MTTPLQEAALNYIERGWPVFRVRPNSKIPYDRWVNGPEHYERATLDPDEVLRRWRGSSTYNIGIATGYASWGGHLTVLDLDSDEDGYAGRPEWATPTYEAQTPSGGRHLYYVTDAPVRSGRIAPGVDVKSSGGMVVAPPSSINGAYYVIDRLSSPAEISAGFFSPTGELSFAAQLSVSKQRRSFSPEERVGAGGRNTYLARYAGWWLAKAEAAWADGLVSGDRAPEPTEYDLAVELDYHNLMVCHPPLPERDVKRIARSIFAKHQRDGGPSL